MALLALKTHICGIKHFVTCRNNVRGVSTRTLETHVTGGKTRADKIPLPHINDTSLHSVIARDIIAVGIVTAGTHAGTDVFSV